ncbi:MAG: SpaA isopeptide-forming pilin-related protein [Candidatus Natronoplasma sp.]
MKGKLLIVVMIGLLLMLGTAAAAGLNEGDPGKELDEDADSEEALEVDREMKNKTFYMYRLKDAVNVGGRTTKEIHNTTYPEGQGNSTDDSYFKVLLDWYLFPPLAGDLELNGTSSLTVWGNSSGGDVDMTYNLTEVDEAGNANEIAGNTVSFTMGNEWTPYEIPLDIDNYTVSEGSTLKITYQIWGDSSTWYSIAYGGMVDGGMRDTNVTLPCKDYVKVSDVYTEDSDGNVTNVFDPEAEDKNMTIRANVTDPFGGYDIEWVNLTLEGPDGVVMENVSMNKTHGEFNSFMTRYEVPWNYENEPDGTYQVTVRAVDKNGMREHNSTGGFGGHDVYGEHSFVIGGRDYYVNIKVADNHQIPLENTTVNLKPGPGTIIDSKDTGPEGIANFTLADATYEITVQWEDVEVSTNRTLDVGEVGNRTEDDPFNVTAAIFYPEITVWDQEDVPVDEARVYITHPNGTTILPPFSTDDNGTFSLERMPGGTYEIEVRWKGRDVGNFERNITWGSIDQTLNVDVYHLTAQVQDDTGQGVPDALVVFSYNDTYQTAESLMTDAQGEVSTRLPGAEYLIEVHWNDAKVYEDTYLLDSSDHLEITADIYEVEILVNDDGEDPQPLEGADVTATYTETEREIGTETTAEDGIVTFQLARGEHRIEVNWLGVDVAEEMIEVDEGQTYFEITAAVYHMDVVTLDDTADEGELSDARVSVRIDGELVDTGFTDDNGVYRSQLPQTHVDIEIEWKGIKVYELNDYLVEDNVEEELLCDVYYLDMQVLDSRDEPIEGSRVSVRYGETVIQRGETDQNGTFLPRLPVEDYTITTSWHGIKVNETEYSMLSERGANELEVYADVYYLNIEVLDDEEEPVEEASVEFFVDGSHLFTETTDPDGMLERRLPAEDYTIQTGWRGFEVNETAVTVDQDIEMTIEASIYHVEFTPVDSQGELIEGGYLEVIHSGSVFESTEAPTSMRVPGEEFQVALEWQGVEVYDEDHLFDESGEIELDSEVYYLTLSGVDSRGEEVSGLIVSIYHDSLPEGQDLLTTISLDETPTERVPAGELRLQAEWRGFIVAEDVPVEVEEDREFEIECDIYYLDVNVVDSEDETLDGANIVVKDEDGTVFVTKSTEDGVVVPRLPSGTWTLDAYWMDRHVGSRTIEIGEENDEITFEVDVHPLEVEVVDSEGVPLQDAEIDLFDHEDNLVFSRSTDEDGTIIYEQLPGGEWSLQVYWMDRTVGTTTLELTEREEITLNTDVHNLNLVVEDSDGQILKGAEVSLLMSEEELVYSRETDGEGEVSFEQVAGGDWNLEVYWQDVLVASEEFTLTETEERTVETDVHTLNVVAVDSDTDALEGAEIVVYGPIEELVYSGESDEEGNISFEQVAGGDWDLEVYWDDHLVAEDNFTLEESEVKNIETDVHTLNVVVVDNEGASLKGAEVTLLDSNGEPISSRETDENGEVEFYQLPGDDYTVKTRYRTTYLLTNVDTEQSEEIGLDSSQTSEMSFGDYPLPFYQTNLFYVIMMLLAVLVIGIVLISRKKEVI